MKRNLSLAAIVSIFTFNVSGGPYALERVFSAGLYSGLGLVYSRVPFVIGQDRFLPKVLITCNRHDAPWVSLVVCGIVFSAVALVFRNAADLASADVTLYDTMVFLERLSFIVMLWREPKLARPVKVSDGWIGVAAVCVFPLACVAGAAYYHVVEIGVWNVVGKPAPAMAVVPLVFPMAMWWRRKQLLHEESQFMK